MPAYLCSIVGFQDRLEASATQASDEKRQLCDELAEKSAAMATLRTQLTTVQVDVEGRDDEIARLRTTVAAARHDAAELQQQCDRYGSPVGRL